MNVCCNCVKWQRVVGHSLGLCTFNSSAKLRNSHGEIIRENCTKAGDSFNCFTPRRVA